MEAKVGKPLVPKLDNLNEVERKLFAALCYAEGLLDTLLYVELDDEEKFDKAMNPIRKAIEIAKKKG